MLSTFRTASLLALTAAIIVAQEVLLTRLLSVTTWYSLAFVVINLAMLGLTAGSLRAARAEREGKPLGPWIGRTMTMFAAGLLAANLLTPLTPLAFAADFTSVVSILIVVVINTVPLIAGGAVIARLMAAGNAPVPVLYAVDLVAAAIGALAPLVLLGPLSAPGAMLLLAALAAAGAWVAAPKTVGVWPPLLIVVAIVGIVAAENNNGVLMWHAKGKPIPYDHPEQERWSALGYVALTPMAVRSPTLWAPSPNFVPSGTYPSSRIYIDADAWTPIHAYRDPAELTFLRYDGVTAAHALRPRGTACIIGVGGGRDIVAALHFGHERVLGIEINPDIVELLHGAADASPVTRDPRVEIVTGDGRAVLARREVQCSVLQASLIDTWAATSAGAFAHTEATLYTREAWGLFLRRVEPDGVLTFSRWYAPGRISETVRLISLAVASLLDRGVANPREHIAMLASTHCATILISPRPFSAADREALFRLERELDLQLLVAPGRRADPLLEQLLEARSVDALVAPGARHGLDTSAPTDDRPFFFQLLAPNAWLHPDTMLATARHGLGGGVIPGNIAATIGMAVMMLVVIAIGIILLGPTIVRSLRSRPAALPGGSAWIYFAALGAGFMIAEIALVQRMHVVLGHPTYALVVVLAGLLVATGVGSATSMYVVRSRRAVSIAALLASALLLVLPFFVIGPLAQRTMDASLLVRALWTGACAALVGFLLGMLFPSGLRFTHRELGAPAALAINGVTSVLGGAAAVMVSVALGIPASFAVAAAFYVIAALTGPIRWRAAEA
jgi:hypothetical protein